MEDPSDDIDLLVTTLIIFDIVGYSYLLVFDVYMVVKYLIYAKKYELTYLVSFYSLTFTLAFLRVCYFITLLRLTGDNLYQEYI